MMNYGQLIVVLGILGLGMVVWIAVEVVEARRREKDRRRAAEYRLIYLQAMDDLANKGAEPSWLNVEEMRKELRELGGTAGGPRDE